MKHFKRLNVWFSSQRHLYWFFVAVLMAVNVFLFFTEDISPLTRVPFLLLPLAFYMALMTLCRRPGTSAWILFPMFFLGAFQMVLLYLFGRSIIASDMFLNLFTTNTGEVGELLGKLLPAILGVCVLYIPTLALAVRSIRLKEKLEGSFRRRRLIEAGILVVVSVLFALAGHTRVMDEVFPANIFYNMVFAAQSWNRSVEYPQRSQDFDFQARATHPDTLREVYVLVIGETARAANFGLYGYSRNTTPCLEKIPGLIAFPDALTQSNTTHKSVPVILSMASADDYSRLYSTKGLLAAFRQAGFHTVFLSNQLPNRSYIDYLAHQGDEYLNFVSGEHAAYDKTMVDTLASVIRRGGPKLLVVMHTHGSHFNYRERYPSSGAYYRPDDLEVVAVREREKLINAYDNSIRYTDEFLAQVIDTVASFRIPAAVFYCSDHGEDLLDDTRKRFLHASPVPTYYQIHIPYLWWFSPQYEALWRDEVSAVRDHRTLPVSTRNVFYTFLDVAGIDTPYAADSLAVSSGKFIPQKRHYLNDHNQPVALDSLGLRDQDVEMMKKNGVSYP